MNKEEFTTEFIRLRVDIYAVFRGMGATHEEAEDLLQETFCRALRNLSTFDTSCELAPWVIQIGRNRARDFLNPKRNPRRRVRSLSDETASGLESPEIKNANLRAELELVLSKLRKIDEQGADVLGMLYLSKMTLTEVGEIFEVYPSTIGIWRDRALDTIRNNAELRDTFLS